MVDACVSNCVVFIDGHCQATVKELNKNTQTLMEMKDFITQSEVKDH